MKTSIIRGRGGRPGVVYPKTYCISSIVEILLGTVITLMCTSSLSGLLIGLAGLPFRHGCHSKPGRSRDNKNRSISPLNL